MPTLRIALANLRFPSTPDESVALATQAIAQAGTEHTDIICFPECYVPGYRAKNKRIPSPDPAFLNRAWDEIGRSAAKANVAVILGTERVLEGSLLATALVVNRDGSTAGFQDKVQIDPSEDETHRAQEGACSRLTASNSGSRSATKDGATQRRYAGRCGEEHRSCFIPTSMKPSLAVTPH